MKKLDLKNVQEFTQFKNPVGGFICTIVDVEDVPHKEYLRVYYDIAEALSDDQQKFVGMYTKRKQEKGYDCPSTVVSYKEQSLPFFKGFVTALENSNPNYKWDNDETKFIGLKIGFVLAEEEYEGKDKNDAPKIRVRVYVAERHSVDAIKSGDFKVPELKKLAQATTKKPANPFARNGAFATPATPQPTSAPTPTNEDEEDCPF